VKRSDLDEGLVQELATLAASWSGFTKDAVHVDAIRRAVTDCLQRPMTPKELRHKAAAKDPQIVDVFRQAVCVGETYFFRSPEHFSFLREGVLAPLVASGANHLRAWSAACSTGEEAYSIAASLLAAVPARSGARLEVLGTDLSPESLRRARLGEYRPWSVRETAPIPVPLLHRTADGRIRVGEDVRAITKFATHDLLDPVPAEFGMFNVIFCRNVLVYFDAAAVRLATKHLAERLLPGGVIVFGVLEVNDPPPGLVSIGGPGLTAFARPLQMTTKVPTRRPKSLSLRSPSPKSAKKTSLKPEPRRSLHPKRRMSLAPAAKSPSSDIKARHIDALHLIEQNQRREALNLLSQIQRQAPAYVAALLDQALLYQKSGHRKLASELMLQILRLTDAFPIETMLPGLEELPVSYYRAAAESFLRGARKERA
jgi:chemotaxis protein methyltransferase CheR